MGSVSRVVGFVGELWFAPCFCSGYCGRHWLNYGLYKWTLAKRCMATLSGNREIGNRKLENRKFREIGWAVCLADRTSDIGKSEIGNREIGNRKIGNRKIGNRKIRKSEIREIGFMVCVASRLYGKSRKSENRKIGNRKIGNRKIGNRKIGKSEIREIGFVVCVA